MPTVTIQQALELALQQHQEGRLDEAETIYRQVLDLDPANADALHLLGVVAHHRGAHAAAVDMIRRAIALKPHMPQFPNNLGNALHRLGRHEEAIAAFRAALALAPNSPETLANLGAAYSEANRLDEAVAANQEALRLNPSFADAHNNLGNVLRKQGRFEDAVVSCQKALQLKPSSPEAFNNLGVALKELGRWEEASAAFHQVIALRPTYAQGHSNLGTVLKEQHRKADALAAFEAALHLAPDDPKTLNNYAAQLDECGETDLAIAAFRRALDLDPTLANTHSNLASVLKVQGRLDEAVHHFRRALALSPAEPCLHSNLILTLLYDPHCPPAELRAECMRWDERHGLPLRPFIVPFRHDPAPDRRLKIGYVSPDFCHHVVGRNVFPLFHEHDRRQVEIYGYSSVRHPDELTGRFRQLADHWRETLGRSDESVSEQIRADGIDILVDLTLHVAHNRLPIFARRPAPIQVSFAGYPGSTGLSAIDYRLTDRHLEPSDAASEPDGERPIRIPSFWCYDPLRSTAEVGPLPAASRGYVTFGCLNNFCKVNEAVVTAWSKILARVAESRLLILTPRGSHRERLVAGLGVNPARVQFVEPCNTDQYLLHYRDIDLILDTFPYNGHTTSLDALWMGVPVLTLTGEVPVSRGGFSQLSNLGLTELATTSVEEYEQLAVALAADLPRLARLRETLRPRMQQSVLMDAPRFAHEIEHAYRTMWMRWCEARPSPGV